MGLGVMCGVGVICGVGCGGDVWSNVTQGEGRDKGRGGGSGGRYEKNAAHRNV